MKIGIKLFAHLIMFLMSATITAQDIPVNAWKSGASWYCNDGYQKQGNECIKLNVPENAWISGSNWYCNDGYQRQDNECIKLKVPENAWISGSNWYCNDGYQKQGDECRKLDVPENAWVSGSSWYCNDGYQKQENECLKFNVPKNAWVSGSNWYCNDGYKKQGDECLKISIPANAYAQGANWHCNEGYKKQAETCIRMSQDELITLKKMQEELKASLSDGTVAFQTKIESDSGDVIKLENGAIVEVSSYFGYIGYRKNAVLFGSGQTCKIWIAGKKSFKCELIEVPEESGKPSKEVHISAVKGNGAILMMLDGSIFEVDAMDTIHTSLWLGVSDGLLINGTTLVNFDAEEAVTVQRIK